MKGELSVAYEARKELKKAGENATVDGKGQRTHRDCRSREGYGR